MVTDFHILHPMCHCTALQPFQCDYSCYLPVSIPPGLIGTHACTWLWLNIYTQYQEYIHILLTISIHTIVILECFTNIKHNYATSIRKGISLAKHSSNTIHWKPLPFCLWKGIGKLLIYLSKSCSVREESSTRNNLCRRHKYRIACIFRRYKCSRLSLIKHVYRIAGKFSGDKIFVVQQYWDISWVIFSWLLSLHCR